MTIKTNTKGIMKSVIKVLVVLVIFYFLGTALYRNWSQINFRQLHFNVPLLIVSILFLFIYFLLFVFGWELILKRLGVSLSFLKAIKIIFYSQIGKYLPGKIWVFVGRIYFCQQLGIPASKIFPFYGTGNGIDHNKRHGYFLGGAFNFSRSPNTY